MNYPNLIFALCVFLFFAFMWYVVLKPCEVAIQASEIKPIQTRPSADSVNPHTYIEANIDNSYRWGTALLCVYILGILIYSTLYIISPSLPFLARIAFTSWIVLDSRKCQIYKYDIFIKTPLILFFYTLIFHGIFITYYLAVRHNSKNGLEPLTK